MKKVIGNHWYNVILIFLVLGCSGGKNHNNKVTTTVPPSPASSARNAKIYYFNNSQNQSIGLIDLDSPAYFRIDDISLRRLSKNGKSKYRDQSNVNRYEVKYSDDGFKLRDSNGNLLWKLKYKADKIKLSNNEEMKNAYDIKQKGEKIIVTQNDNPVDSLNLGSGSVPAVIKTSNRTLVISGPTRSPAFALLRFSSIPAELQMILITEVLLSGR